MKSRTKQIAFNVMGICERCDKDVLTSSTGICKKCYEEILEIRKDPQKVRARLGKLNLIESGILHHATQKARFQTRQTPPPPRPLGIRLTKKIEFYRNSKPEDFLKLRKENVVHEEIIYINTEFVKHLKNDLNRIHALSSRQFEELISEILRDMGCEVTLTPQTRDGGRDILAVFKNKMGEFLTVVECEKYSPENKIGIAVVERFLYTINDKDRASKGLIVTTSFFSQEATATAKEYKYKLGLVDWPKLQNWVARYGDWHQVDESGLWIPNSK